MEKNVRVFIKLVAALFLTALFLWLIYTDENVLQLKQPEGDLIKAKDVLILLSALEESGAGQMEDSVLDAVTALAERNQNLDYRTYQEILASVPEETEKITYKNKYRDTFYLLKKDWYAAYQMILASYGLTDVICQETVEILCGNQLLRGEKTIQDGCLLGKDGRVYRYGSDDFINLNYTKVKAYVQGDCLLTLLEALPEESVLENVWITDADEEQVSFFYKDYEITGVYSRPLQESRLLREQVGALRFCQGSIEEITVKRERISGKLISVSENSMEIEGYGSLPVKEECVGYQIYEKLRMAKKSELSIGYDFADFVLEDGEICAFLIARKEKMETIRVAIKNDGFQSLYHEEIVLFMQDPVTIYYGEYGQRKEEKRKAGEQLIIRAESDYLSGDRLQIVPETNMGKVQVLSLNRSQGAPCYRGSMEIVKTEEGLALINELLLEEYLYSVLPSEMPAAYPAEALKAQAVCARTYGYRYLQQPGYAALGAHVDDSVGYQVYNNIAENGNTTKAVKETTGILLLYQGEPVNTYYYSTSCGFGADPGIWNEEQKEQYPYLSSLYISRQEKEVEAAELAEEEKFQAYITGTDENAYEKEEAWFRWQYQVEQIDVSLLYQKMKERAQAVPEKILTFTGKEDRYEAGEIREFQKVYGIQCDKRKEGGVLDELLLQTDQGTYKVVSEYNIRYVLNQGGAVIRQDGSAYESSGLLPSAYFMIHTVKEKENVVGYTIIGGGYGHGVGMSQNGAKAMALEEKDCESILSFYFDGCYLEKIY